MPITDISPPVPLQPGQRIARGVQRHLREHDFTSLLEFVPAGGLRVDVIALGPKGEIWIVECKSGREDFRTDAKWRNYLPWCDRFFWAVEADFPAELLPQETGLIVGDDFDAEIQRWPESLPMAAARRKALTRRFARTAADRLQRAQEALPRASPRA
jgi:hypothetical protein